MIERDLHAKYCELSGQDIPLRFGRDRAWSDFVRNGFTMGDLILVITYLKKGIAKGERNPGSLRFRNLIEQADAFEEELALAKSAMNARKRPVETPKPLETPLHGGESVTRLVTPPPAEIPRVDFKAEVERLRKGTKS